MKTKLIVLCVVVAVLCLSVLYLYQYLCRLYPETMVVVDVMEDIDGYIVTFQTASGNEFEYITDDGDICENEVYAVLMYSRSTKTVLDDEIVKIKYVGEDR